MHWNLPPFGLLIQQCVQFQERHGWLLAVWFETRLLIYQYGGDVHQSMNTNLVDLSGACHLPIVIAEEVAHSSHAGLGEMGPVLPHHQEPACVTLDGK